MTVSAIKVTLGADMGEGKFNSSTSYNSDPVANSAATLAALDVAGAAIVAITGDTYSNVTHQFTFGGATGLTHAQWATNGALLNTAFAAAAATNGGLSGNLIVLVDTAAITISNAYHWALKQALQAAKNIGIVTP